MKLIDFLEKNPPIQIDSYRVVSLLLGVSNTRARTLIQQGAISVERNGVKIKIGIDDWFLMNDIVKIGKGRFYKLCVEN